MPKPLYELCDLLAVMTRVHDGQPTGALAITPVYRVVLTPGLPHHLALLSLQGSL
jgi:hypothetical protein